MGPNLPVGAGGWRSAIFIIWVEVAERFAYYGIAGNLITYLTKVMGEPTVTAARNVNVWSGVSTILPVGLVLLTVAVAISQSQFKKPLFFISLYLVAIGQGGHKPCVQAFGADQFKEESEEERRTKNSFFNWWYLAICVIITSNHCTSEKCRFLDKASFIDEKDVSHEFKNKWRLCSTAQVEEVKMLIRLVPIWVSCLMYAVVFAQPNTFFIKQGSTLDRNIGTFVVPSASLLVAVGLTAVVAVFIYDRFIVPITRKITGTSSGLTMLQRIGVGIFLSIIVMIAAALVERRRLKIVREFGLVDHPHASVPMSVWWLLPQYMILGVADVFTLVGLQQFFYDQMPGGLRSIGAAAYLCIMGVGSFISGGIISIVGSSSGWLVDNLNSAHLDYYYWLLAGLSALWFGLFLVLSRQFLYKQVADALP
ncbi:Proton-dependent oligopeptide transporter family [Cinnamomum micranthum f. kanehirae]|uniref:Proton-dependent oligopeptide transporter family n=1 Tax=Cinnamomum micranthum f. kanehirae TaxID=337451 RepID=A0A3S3QHW0_9MAGN|nr:Proton-dependent oligopeptide transporter family [Cinnamomum micranthum f. kanehirae]